MTDASSNMLGKWAESAVYWAKHQGLIRAMFAPVTDALMVETGISRDDLVLDVAAGPGEPSMTIADRVGPSGRVCCTDGVLPMVLASRTEAGRRKLRNIDFCQCRAEALPFRDAAFDALVCRFGVMFCEDPTAAAREMLRVTKPTRWISLAAWSFDEVNPFHSIVTHVLNQYDPVPATDFNAV
ncbi:MAG: class I SAM-dependent methyltransferase, partial [Planctomycetota bacterium]